VSFTDFVASDAAIEAMSGQYLGGRPISLSYAFKKEGGKGERHGSSAERLLADLGKKNNVLITGFLPPAALTSLPPIPAGFTQAAVAAPGGAPAAAPGQYAPAPGGSLGVTGPPGQAATGFAPPQMPPPPGFGQAFGR
jgi:splicing factor 3B subunit 4